MQFPVSGQRRYLFGGKGTTPDLSAALTAKGLCWCGYRRKPGTPPAVVNAGEPAGSLSGLGGLEQRSLILQPQGAGPLPQVRNSYRTPLHLAMTVTGRERTPGSLSTQEPHQFKSELHFGGKKKY